MTPRRRTPARNWFWPPAAAAVVATSDGGIEGKLLPIDARRNAREAKQNDEAHPLLRAATLIRRFVWRPCHNGK